MNERKRLYLVRCVGMNSSLAGDVKHGLAYVVAVNPEEAYRRVRETLDRLDLGFYRERELSSVELIAEEGDYPNVTTRLFA